MNETSLIEEVFPAYPEYQESKVEWLGEVPAHWEVVKFKYLAHINPSKQNALEGLEEKASVSFLPMEKVSENGTVKYDIVKPVNEVSSGFTFFEKHDILVAKITPCFENGKGALLSEMPTDIGFGSTEFHVLRAKSGVNNQFIYRLTRIDRFMKIGEAFMTGSAGQKRVPTSFIENFLVALPPLSEQRQIAHFLDHKTAQIDAAIEKGRRLIELLREERAALINEAVTAGVDKHGHLRSKPTQLPAEEWKDSGVEWLGVVPEEWEVVKLRYLSSKIGSGVTPKGGSNTYLDEGIPLLRSQNIYFNGLRLDDVAYISSNVHESMANSKVLSGDILLNITGGSIGRCYYINDSFGEANVNQHVCIIRPIRSKALTSFLHSFLGSYSGQLQIRMSQTGGNREGLNFEQLGNFVLAIPPLSDQHRIVHYIETETTRIDRETSILKREIELLAEYRQALISEAVTGKIDVREVEVDG